MAATEKRPKRSPGSDGATRRAGSKKRQHEIIDAAAMIFHRKGYSETSVQDVADAVEILKGSLYYYIDSKEDLLFQMLLEVHEEAKGVVAETAALDLPPLERLRIYLQRHVEYNTRNLAKIAVYYHDFALLSPQRKAKIIGSRRCYETFVQDLIEEAQQRGDVDGSLDPVVLRNAIFGAVNWIYTWYDPTGMVSPEYLGGLYAEIALRGISGANMSREVTQIMPGK